MGRVEEVSESYLMLWAAVMVGLPLGTSRAVCRGQHYYKIFVQINNSCT